MAVSRREGRHQATRAKIISAARNIIKKQGFEELSTRQVAALADCSLGTIYNHFADFDDVILHVNIETIERLDAAISINADCPFERRLEAVVEAYFDFVDANQPAWRALFEHSLPKGYKLPSWYRLAV